MGGEDPGGSRLEEEGEVTQEPRDPQFLDEYDAADEVIRLNSNVKCH